MADEPSTDIARPADVEQVQHVKLVVVAGPDQGRVLEPAAARVGIGTQEGNALLLSDRTVSRFHCELVRADGRVRLKDLGSKNGTYVDSVHVLEAVLRSGQVIHVGNTQIRADLRDESVSLPLSGAE